MKPHSKLLLFSSVWLFCVASVVGYAYVTGDFLNVLSPSVVIMASPAVFSIITAPFIRSEWGQIITLIIWLGFAAITCLTLGFNPFGILFLTVPAIASTFGRSKVIESLILTLFVAGLIFYASESALISESVSEDIFQREWIIHCSIISTVVLMVLSILVPSQNFQSQTIGANHEYAATNIEAKAELPLFRETAVDAFAKRSYGRPIAKMPRSWMYFSLMLLAMVGVAVWFLATSTYSRKEAALGWLAPKEGLVRISVSQGGLLEEALFDQGQRVEKGQALFVLSQDKKLVSGTGATEYMLQKLDQERREIHSQIDIENASRVSDIEAAKALLEQLTLERTEIGEQIRQQEDRVFIQGEIFQKFERLNAQDETVSYLELQTQKERYLSQKQALAALRQRQAMLGREIINTRSVLTKRPLESERIKSELQRRLIEIANRETNLSTQGREAILAPVTGTVATVEVKAGNTVYPQQLLASILPENSDLYAEVYIPSRAIGFIKPDQSVRVMYTAFPHQRFGAANGSVLEVSNTVLRPEEIPTSIGLEEPAYKARIALEKQTMEGFGDVLPLRPGMALQAEIILEKRSFLQWILEPLRARRSA